MPTIPMQTRGQFLLSGFLYCAYCGARVNGSTSRKQYRRKDGSLYQQDRRTYRCNASVDGVPVECEGPRTYRAERIEETFKTAISSLLETTGGFACGNNPGIQVSNRTQRTEKGI